MSRPPSPSKGISDAEWELRVWVAARTRELLGDRPAAYLARLLGDTSRTRAHKILNPTKDRNQAITYALVEELARALTDGSVVAFLATRLGAGEAQALEAEAHQRLVGEIAAYQRQQLEQWKRAVQREDVRRLLQDVSNSAPLMPEANVRFLSELVFAWREKFGLSAFAGLDDPGRKALMEALATAPTTRINYRELEQEGSDGDQ